MNNNNNNNTLIFLFSHNKTITSKAATVTDTRDAVWNVLHII